MPVVDMHERVPITFELYEMVTDNGIEVPDHVETVTGMVTRNDVVTLANESPFTSFTVDGKSYRFMGLDIRKDLPKADSRSFVVMLVEQREEPDLKFNLLHKNDGDSGFEG